MGGYLDPRTRRRMAAGLLVAIIVIVALAITDIGPFADPEPPPTEEEIVADTVEEFFAAAADNDFKTFCAAMTGEFRTQVQREGAELAAEQGLEGCEEILAVEYEDAFRDPALDITEVSVSGPQARVEVNLKLAGQDDRTEFSVALLDTEGEWKVSAFN